MDQSLYFDTITSRTWDFGDGNITATTAANITHTYTQNGTYTVSLTVNGTQAGVNITSTETKTNYITVYDSKPAADFYATPTCGTPPLTVNFHDNSTSYDGITSWLWDFGDETNSTEQNPTHNYTVAGVYTVSLTVTEPDGDTNVCIKEDYIIVDDTAPTITNVLQNPPADNVQPTDTVKVNATVTDALSGIKNVTLLYSTDGGETWIPVLMEPAGQVYSGTIPAFPYATVVQYYIEALDNAGNKEVSPEARRE